MLLHEKLPPVLQRRRKTRGSMMRRNYLFLLNFYRRRFGLLLTRERQLLKRVAILRRAATAHCKRPRYLADVHIAF